MNFLSLFAGIGGIDLGLERAGMKCVGQVEIDPFYRAVLEKHWPSVRRFADIRSFNGSEIDQPIDLVAGGFPCQPVSVAGKGLAQADARWLWPEMLRIIRSIRPTWVFAENVPGLRSRGADIVLGDLEAAGYAPTAIVVGADNCTAPHRRRRVWIVARQLVHADGTRLERAEWGGIQGEKEGRAGGAISRIFAISASILAGETFSNHSNSD